MTQSLEPNTLILPHTIQRVPSVPGSLKLVYLVDFNSLIVQYLTYFDINFTLQVEFMIVHKLRISRSEGNSPDEREYFQWQFVNRNQFFMHSFFVNYSILIFIAFLMILLMLLIFL